jgi:hypothetical protein
MRDLAREFSAADDFKINAADAETTRGSAHDSWRA